MYKAIVPLIVFFAFCSGVGLGYYYKYKDTVKEAKAVQQKKGPPELPLLKLKKETILIEEEFTGRVVANRIAEIRPQVGGIITKRLFVEGSDVVEGQPLYQIESATYQSVFDKAKADLEKATTNLQLTQTKSKRYDELIKIEGVSKQEFDDMQATLALSKADVHLAEVALNNAKIILGYTQIVAPISGRIGKSIVNEGSLVTPSQAAPLATITQFDQVYVDINQSSADYLRLRDQLGKNEKISARLFLVENEKLYGHEGELQFSSVLVDQTTGSLQLRVLFSNVEHELLPGLFVKVRLKLGTQEAIMIPQRATNRNADGELFVWKYNETDAVRQVVVKSVKTVGDKWLVTDGVKPGDRIVFKGFQKIPLDGKILEKKEGKE